MTGGRPSLFRDFLYRCRETVIWPVSDTPAYGIFYVHEGDGDIFIGERTIALSSGSLVVTDGTRQAGITSKGPDGCAVTWLSIVPSAWGTLEAPADGIDLLLPFMVLGHDHVRLTGEAKEECEDVWCRLNRFHGSEDWVDVNRLAMAFYDLLVLVYAQFEPMMKGRNFTLSEKERNVRKVMAYIENAFNEDITLGDIERELHMSKQYVSKIFRESTGMTIFDYVYRRRINQAKRLLDWQRDRSVTDIGLQVGFKSVSHFSRVFKHQVGLSPERYRRLLAEESASRRAAPGNDQIQANERSLM